MSVSVVIKHASTTVGEGPHWDETNQTLLHVDILSGDVHRWNSETGVDEKRHIGNTASLIVPSSKGGYIVSVDRALCHLDWDTNTVTQITEVEHGTTNRFNDGKCDAKGRLWAGTMGREIRPAVLEMGQGTLYTLDTERTITEHINNLNISNGIAWTDDNRIMYFIDTLPGNIYAYDFDVDKGSINEASRRVVVDFRGLKTGLADGMTIDTEGKLWVACFTGGKVVRLDPETGKILREVIFENASRITSCCFGGKNFDDLYVTSARAGVTEEEFRTTESLAGSVFKVTGLGVKGKPADVFRG